MTFSRNPLRACLLAFTFFALTLLASPVLFAATVIVVNNDGAGEGFNDATAAVAVGGNTGTTIGAQRLIAFQHAANIWGGLLASAVPIRVGAQFNPLTCSDFSAILGSAGPNNGAYRNFTGAPVAATWYPVALANALHGSDLDPSGDDILATFNSNIGTPGCLSSSGWYYGLDSNPPGSKIDFVSTLVHELGHGLGFLTLVDLATGAKALGSDDTFMRNLEDHAATPPGYPAMSDAQRITASKHTGSLHWVGANVRAASGVLTAGKVGDHVRMYAPNPQQPGSSVSHWDTALTPDQVMEPSYTTALHNPVLELPLFQDIGWTLLGTSYTLSVSQLGTGTGTVTSSPAGINCGATCSAAYSSGSSVTLTAAANPGSTFTGWSGAGCTGTGSCIVSMTSAQSVTASFALGDFALSVNKSGTGTGSVTSNPAGINCGATCNAGYNNGSSVALTAAADAGSSFAGWSGAGCSGTGSCIVSMTSAQSVNAAFARIVVTSTLTNISTRGYVGTGANVLIGGFIISGDTPMTVLIRARGPSLAAFSVPGVLANPMMGLYSGPTEIASNDNWGSASNAADISATGLAPTNTLESAILTTLDPGPYTVIVRGVGNTSGVGIVEVLAQ